ncbi:MULTISPECIES: SusC/RagA family TonB-linked outer membrane protein [Galbibacter]|uniref:SusC/RagA family TonB-linked outer membrane protein n=1 Tax=Galbibacter orientalis TaxID=453852 RepID=UPI0030029F55
MRTKFSGFLTLILALIVQITFAQEKTVTGVITDQDGLPLPGANVVVKGTSNGTQTDFDGNYSIQANTGDVLVYSFVGQKTEERTVGASNAIDITLQQDAQALDEVVVTALGIKREKKSLTYSSQEVNTDVITKGTTNTGNVASQLSGKVAGLQVNTNNNFGGSTNLVIRGYKSLKGGSPLIVIDGSPVSNSSLSGQYDYGNFLSDINQEDIQSINVLKGAAASALYGERGLNGVIVITTKTGKKSDDGSWGVSLNSSTSVGSVNKETFPEYQNQYGGGYGPYEAFGNDYTNYNDDASLGPKYDGHLVYAWDSFDPTSPNYNKQTPYVAGESTPIDFFKSSTNFANTVSLEKANEKSNILINYTNQIMNGILPNSEIKKNTVSAKFNYDLTDNLSATVYSSLTLQSTVGRNETGYSDNQASSFRQWWNVDADLTKLRDAYNRTGLNTTWNRKSPTDGTPAYWDNPYFQRHESYTSDDRTRSFSYGALNYKFNDNFNLMGKMSYDDLNLLIENRLAVGSGPRAWGNSGNTVGSGYSKQLIDQTELNFDVIFNYQFNLTENIDLSGLVGGNVRRNKYSNMYASTEGGLIVPNLYSLSNSASDVLPPNEDEYTTLTSGAYATASLGLFSTYFIDGTYRVDQSSTLPEDNNTFGYGSIAGSVVLSNLIEADWLSFWKLRGNYAVVGGSTDPYQLVNTYSNIGSSGGVVLFDTANTLKNSELKPERSKEVEVGMEMQFFGRRLGLDVTAYQSRTTDQIINLPISASTGYRSTVFNAGRIDNKGIEVALNASPVRNENFSWDIDINWAKNQNEVIDLRGVDNYQIGSYQGGVTLNASVGQAFGTLMGTDYVYLNGERVIKSNGLYEQSERKVIGNITPDWTGGIRNSFNYKGFGLSFLIDMQHGGDTFSTDLWYGYAGGLYADTVGSEFRDPSGVVLDGVQADGSPNTVEVGNGALTPGNYYSYQPKGYNNAPNSEFVYDASYIKLREISLSYSLSGNLLKNTFIQEATVSLIGRNLHIFSKNIPYVDPEAGVGGGLRSRGNSIGILPTTRDVGLNLNIKF